MTTKKKATPKKDSKAQFVLSDVLFKDTYSAVLSALESLIDVPVNMTEDGDPVLGEATYDLGDSGFVLYIASVCGDPEVAITSLGENIYISMVDTPDIADIAKGLYKHVPKDVAYKIMCEARNVLKSISDANGKISRKGEKEHAE